MSEQATLAIVKVPPAVSNGVHAETEGRPKRRAMRGSSHWKTRGAPERIQELLGELKAEKQLRAQDRIEAKQTLAAADAEIERLRDEVNLCRHAEEDRLFILREREKAEDARVESEREVEEDRREYCLSALIGAAHEENLYAQRPDFDTRIKKFDSPLSTRLLAELIQFPKEIIGQMAYAIAGNEPVLKKLSVLANELPWAAVRWLVKISMDFENDVRVRRIQENLMRW